MNRYQRYAFDWEQIDPTSFEDDTPCMGPGWTKQNGLCWRVFRRKRKGVFQTKERLSNQLFLRFTEVLRETILASFTLN